MMIYILFFLVALLIIPRVKRKPGTVAFFHPYCNAGGGGERVLWCAIRAMQIRFPKLTYIVFSGDRDASKEQILLRAKQRFGIEVDPVNVEFIFLRLRTLVEAKWYPRFTLILQTIAGGILSIEALFHLCPSLFIDTMGYPLSLPVFKWLGGCDVAAYVHYPTISCDMIDMVARREAAYNNNEAIAKSSLLSFLKLGYYRAFAMAYGLAGRSADVVMVNGSWTKSHISRLWHQPCRVVFPPCDIDSLLGIPVRSEAKLSSESTVSILSIGQIRPEKNHRLQLEVLRGVLDEVEKRKMNIQITLIIAGGCRNAEDEERVAQLKEYAKKLKVDKNVQWQLNVPYDVLFELLNTSLISIHTMWNEHFGISVVEALAAGTITVAHKSGGPEMDIVVPSTGDDTIGYLAATKEEYTDCIMEVFSQSVASRSRMREAARASSIRFSQSHFDDQWIESIAPLMEQV